MNDLKPVENKQTEKPGFFTRILNKVDTAMKEKADANAKNQCCSSDDKGKGGKCC